MLHSYFAGHALFKEFESSHQAFAVGGGGGGGGVEPGWLGIRLFAALIRNTCMFLIISAIVHKDLTNL